MGVRDPPDRRHLRPRGGGLDSPREPPRNPPRGPGRPSAVPRPQFRPDPRLHLLWLPAGPRRPPRVPPAVERGAARGPRVAPHPPRDGPRAFSNDTAPSESYTLSRDDERGE